MNDLLQHEIKGKKVVYYLTSKDDLESIKSKSIFSDIFLCLFSLSAGGILSIYLTKLLGSLSNEVLEKLSIVNSFLWVATIIFLAFYITMLVQSILQIRGITKGGAISSFNIEQSREEKTGLKIIYALYYTQKANREITDKLNKRIIENSLNITCDNEISGQYDDPDPGNAKKLKLKYSYNGLIFDKEYNEGDKIILP
jgi:hypothetical protein